VKIVLDLRKKALENAQEFFENAKKFKKKAEGARKAILEIRKKLSQENAGAEKTGKAGKGERKTKWFHEFRFFTTTNGFLCIGGKTAKQNDILFSKHLKENDLFFHADVHGASAVVLKDGVRAGERDLMEAAQFAACYSNAWKLGSGVADVYCVGKSQVSKHSRGEFVGKGAFLISGERRWFKNVELKIAIGLKDGELVSIPAMAAQKTGRFVFLVPGEKTKEELFALLKDKLELKKNEEFFGLLPGKSEIV